MQVGDRTYRSAQQARRGELRLDPLFDGFVQRFTDRFGFAPLWLETDHVEGRHRVLRPRLGVVLEREAQAGRFFRPSGGHDTLTTRVVAELFLDAMAGADLRPLFGLPHDAPPVSRDDLHVSVSGFESAAVADAHGSLTETELERFTSSVSSDLGERFWQAFRLSSAPVVLVHTAAQAAQLASSPLRQSWADLWFELASGHDEFGFLRREDVVVRVDSKENFDTNYDSNWSYYVR